MSVTTDLVLLLFQILSESGKTIIFQVQTDISIMFHWQSYYVTDFEENALPEGSHHTEILQSPEASCSSELEIGPGSVTSLKLPMQRH